MRSLFKLFLIVVFSILTNTRVNAEVVHIGAGFETGSVICKTILVSDLVGSSAGISVNIMDESAVSPETRNKIQMLAIVASLPQMLTSIRKINDLVTSIDNEINAISKASVRNKAKFYFSKVKVKALAEAGGSDLFSITKFKNTIAKIPGIDNGSLTNLPKSFWDDAYKLKPKNTSALKTKVDNIISNGDQSGKLTETLVEDIMTANGYKVGNGRYYGDYETARNGLDGFFYKGDIANPSEIIVIDSKQMKINGSVKLNNGNSSTGLPSQMKEQWIRYIANNKLTDLTNTVQQNTKIAIQNSAPGFIKKYVVAVDKSTGEINFLKLSDNF